MSFLKDLRQRRIFRILITYLAGGWLALEAVDQLVNNEVLPLLAYQLGLVLFLAGIPAALIVGWYHGEKGHQRAQPLELGLLGILIIGTVVSGGMVVQRAQESGEQFGSASSLPASSVAILYFESDEEARPIADGLTEALIDQFEAVPSLQVVSQNGVALYRDSTLPPDSIARALGAGTLIRGSVDREGDEVRTTIRLLDGGSGAEFERAAFAWPVDSVLTARASLARGVSELLRNFLGDEVELRQRRRGTESVSAWLLVQQAERELRRAEDAIEHGEAEPGWLSLERADSLVARAAEADTAWIEPALLQARIDYRFGRLHDAEPLEAERYHQDALAHLSRAMRLDSRSAEAYALRGRIDYVRWLLGVEVDPAAAEALLASAEEDLRRATTLDANHASAWSLLAHLAYQRDDIQDGYLNAQAAYRADAYLDEIDLVLWRLFHTSYDLENFTQARGWCLEGAERFPDDPAFMECRLWLMTAEAIEPDVEEAWRLVEAISERAPESVREQRTLNARLLAAGAIARAGLEDSARAVLYRSRGNPRIDPTRELLIRRAFVYTLLDDDDAAIDNLREFLTANPDRVEGFREHGHWWWRDLRSNEAFQRLIGS